MKKTLYLKHSGRMGDIIYCLMAVIPFARKNHFKIHFLLSSNPAWKNISNGDHPFPGMINDSNIKDLIEIISDPDLGIEASEFVPSDLPQLGNEDRLYDMDHIKVYGSSYGLPYGDVRKWYQYAYPELNVGTNWHHYGNHARFGASSDNEIIIVNRTKRYQNPNILYSSLSGMKNVFFAGLDDEYEEFLYHVPNCQRISKQFALLHIAWLIQHCKLFIGNQSFLYSLAEYYQVPRLLEVGSPNNVIPMGRNGYDFHTQEALEFYLKEYANS